MTRRVPQMRIACAHAAPILGIMSMREKFNNALQSTVGFFTAWAATFASLVITFFTISEDKTARFVACVIVVLMFFLSCFRDRGTANVRKELAETQTARANAEYTLRKIGTWKQQFHAMRDSYASEKLEAANLNQLWLDAEEKGHRGYIPYLRDNAEAARKNWENAEKACTATGDKLTNLQDELIRLTGVALSTSSTADLSGSNRSLP